MTTKCMHLNQMDLDDLVDLFGQLDDLFSDMTLDHKSYGRTEAAAKTEDFETQANYWYHRFRQVRVGEIPRNANTGQPSCQDCS